MSSQTFAAVGFAANRSPFIFAAPVVAFRPSCHRRRPDTDSERRTLLRETRIARTRERLPAASRSRPATGVRSDGLEVPDHVVGYH